MIGTAVSDAAISWVIGVILKKVTNVQFEKQIKKAFRKSVKKSLHRRCVSKKELEEYAKGFESYILGTRLVYEGMDEARKAQLTSFFEILAHDYHAAFNYVSAIKDDKRYETVEQIDNRTKEIELHTEQIKEMSGEMMALLNQIRNGAGVVGGIVSGEVKNLVSQLRVNSAFAVLQEIERLCKNEIDKDVKLKAEICGLKGKCKIFEGGKYAYKMFHDAYLLDNANYDNYDGEVKYRLRNNDEEGALSLCHQLPESSEIRVVVEVAVSADAKAVYSLLPTEMRGNIGLRYELASILERKSIDTSFLYDGPVPDVPEDLCYDNLKTWFYILNWYRSKFVFIPLSREAPQIQQMPFREAYLFADKFYQLLSRTDIADVHYVVKALADYWGFVATDNKSFRDTFLHTERNKEQKIQYAVMGSSMLMMSGLVNEAFDLMKITEQDVDGQLLQMLFAMTRAGKQPERLTYIFNLCREKNIVVDTMCAGAIAVAICGKSAMVIKENLSTLVYENKTNLLVLQLLCEQTLVGKVDTSGLKEQLDRFDAEMLPYVALLLHENGDEEDAYAILNEKVDEETYDLRLRVFLEILSTKTEYQPRLFRLLNRNRKAGHPIEVALLMKEFDLSMQIPDYQNALEVITILRERQPESERVFVNYLEVLSYVAPDRLGQFESQVLNLKLTSVRNIRIVYDAFVKNGYAQTALVFLYDNAICGPDDVRFLYHAESLHGPICSMVNQEYGVVEDGSYVLCGEKDQRRKMVKAVAGTPLGDALIGKTKGELAEWNNCGEKTIYEIVLIQNKYAKLAYDIMKEATETGGNRYLHPFRLDMTRPLESLQECILQLDPQAKDYASNRRNRIAEYQDGKGLLVSLIEHEHLIEGYYGLLFSDFKVHTQSLKAYMAAGLQMVGEETGLVLDITSLLLLFEFAVKNNYTYSRKFIVSGALYEYIKYESKGTVVNVNMDYLKAINPSVITRYDADLCTDRVRRLSELVRWMDSHCVVKNSVETLAVGGTEKRLGARLFCASGCLMLEAGHCFVSEENFEHTNVPYISTEIAVYAIEGAEVARCFSRFLSECCVIGVDYATEDVVNEYRQMENGEENKFYNICLSMERNPYLISVAINASLAIVRGSKNKKQAQSSVTNMISMCFKGMAPQFFKSGYLELLGKLNRVGYEYDVVRCCMKDARKIVSPIILI